MFAISAGEHVTVIYVYFVRFLLAWLACLLAGWLAGLLACFGCVPAFLAGLLSCLPAGFIVRPSGRQIRHPTQAHMWGDNGRQKEARPRERGHTTQAPMWGENGRQG